MKTILLSLLFLAPAAHAWTPIQTQDVGRSTIAWTGIETFSGSTTTIDHGTLIFDTSASTRAAMTASQITWIYSMDAITQSSGCAMAYGLNANTGAGSDYLVMTTTTDATGTYPFCVLAASCVPKTLCPCITGGLARSTVINTTACTIGRQVQLSSTRCQLAASGSAAPTQNGFCLSGNAAGTPGWIKLYGGGL